MTMKQLMDLQPVDELSPQYLNAFRNTPWYQNALAHGVKQGRNVIPITLADLILADREKVGLVFDGKHDCTDGNKKHKPTYDTIYRSPTAKVVTFMDKIALTRAADETAFEDPLLNLNAINGYTAALERLARTDQSISRVKGKETKAKHVWCRDTLTEAVQSEDGLNALALWALYRGEGEPRIKNVKTAKQVFQNIIQYQTSRLCTANQKVADYIKRLLE